MMQKHLSSQFDAELNTVSARVMELGGLVESQIGHAIRALSHFSLEAVETVATLETRVNALEVDIDRELSTIIARRQPTARDLRLLMAFSKATANLERMGDEGAVEEIKRLELDTAWGEERTGHAGWGDERTGITEWALPE